MAQNSFKPFIFEAMPEVGVQTERDDEMSLMECRLQAMSIILGNGWSHYVKSSSQPSGVEFIIDKSYFEDVYFEGFPSGHHFTDNEWHSIQKKAKEFLEMGVYPNYGVSDAHEIKHTVRDITFSTLGFPFHFVELIYTDGLMVENDVEHYDIRIPLGEKTVNSLDYEYVIDMLYEEHFKDRGEHRQAIYLKRLMTRQGEFKDFGGNPLCGLGRRSLRSYLHINDNDDDVERLGDYSDWDAYLEPQVYQVVVNPWYEPSEHSDESSYEESDECK